MTPDVIRRQYLDAMGITAWTSRYQLPNARLTEACEWEDAPAATPPRERLHALLDDVPAPRLRSQPANVDGGASSSAPAAVRALLGQPPAADSTPVEVPIASTLEISTQENATPEKQAVSKAEPLTFSLSCVCIGGRWLSLHEGEITPTEQQLLANILRGAGMLSGEMPAVTYFKWPPMANTFMPEEPLEEAQEGVAAFIAGAAGRQGWQLERLLWWGADELPDDSPLVRVMAVSQQQSQTLSLPVWQGPALKTLAEHASAKRKLWPALVSLRELWRAEVTTQ
ncbi:hypothetical protein [Halomonas sp. TD01]|uniref:hypothetical protein n=1 Tax=Halomonas sp. TD01 TaxID=999141 RepID=UPI000214F9AC|nr:hypothetical protein [Halomonas sp. TD01]EGP18793.1 hypothetical protein GME_14425 [Halomonas sp. TD01]CAH1042187.1 hypothetical protein HPTD01_665 [Halomonas sp. TD01]